VLKVVNWPSCLGSRFAHIVKVSKLDFRRRHVIEAELFSVGMLWIGGGRQALPGPYLFQPIKAIKIDASSLFKFEQHVGCKALIATATMSDIDNESYSNSGFDEESIVSIDVTQKSANASSFTEYEDDFDSPALTQKSINASNVTEYDDDFDSDEDNDRNDEQKPGALVTGQRVEARHGGQAQWYGAVITHTNTSSGHYDVDYDDGDQEQSVRRYRIRSDDTEQMLDILHNEDEVDVFHDAGATLYAGKIGKQGPGNTYEIHYNDGDKEEGVARQLIFASYFHASEKTTALVPSATRAPFPEEVGGDDDATDPTGADIFTPEISEAERAAAAAQDAVMSTEPTGSSAVNSSAVNSSAVNSSSAINTSEQESRGKILGESFLSSLCSLHCRITVDFIAGISALLDDTSNSHSSTRPTAAPKLAHTAPPSVTTSTTSQSPMGGSTFDGFLSPGPQGFSASARSGRCMMYCALFTVH
jgi:hypothetical protein